MPQTSIPYVAHLPLEWRPPKINPTLLCNAPKLPAERYLDDEHHLAIYCPECGVRCSRVPRKTAERKDHVLAYFAHIRGYDEVSCPHRKPTNHAGADGIQRERKAANLLILSGWKIGGEELANHEENGQAHKPKRIVQAGSAGKGQGFKLLPAANGLMLHAGEFHTVRRLVKVAFNFIDTLIQFPDQEPTRLGNMFVRVNKIQRHSPHYIGKSFLFFGQPTSIFVGDRYVFFNFMEHEHHVAVWCDPAVFEQLKWKTSDRDYCYIFHGLLEANDKCSFVRIIYFGQICRFSAPTAELLDRLL